MGSLQTELANKQAEDTRDLLQIEQLKTQIAELQNDISALGSGQDTAALEKFKELKKAQTDNQQELASLMQTWKAAFEFNNHCNPTGAEASGEPDAKKMINPRTVRVEQRAAFDIHSREKIRRVTLTDTKGFGDDMDANDTIAPIKDEILSRLQQHKEAVESHKLTNSKEDGLIHACLYFIRPHRFSGIDKQFMKELSPLVNIIPIIAKADSMTVDELKEFKRSVKDDLEAESIDYYEFATKAQKLVVDEEARIRQLLISNNNALLDECPQIDTSSMEQSYKLQEPFAVIASDNRDAEQDVRTYPFGTAKGTNPLHSDFPSLRQLTINHGPEYLRDTALDKFQSWTQRARAAAEQQAATEKAEQKAARLAAEQQAAAVKAARMLAVKRMASYGLAVGLILMVVVLAYLAGQHNAATAEGVELASVTAQHKMQIEEAYRRFAALEKVSVQQQDELVKKKQALKAADEAKVKAEATVQTITTEAAQAKAKAQGLHRELEASVRAEKAKKEAAEKLVKDAKAQARAAAQATEKADAAAEKRMRHCQTELTTCRKDRAATEASCYTAHEVKGSLKASITRLCDIQKSRYFTSPEVLAECRATGMEV